MVALGGGLFLMSEVPLYTPNLMSGSVKHLLEEEEQLRLHLLLIPPHTPHPTSQTLVLYPEEAHLWSGGLHPTGILRS